MPSTARFSTLGDCRSECSTIGNHAEQVFRTTRDARPGTASVEKEISERKRKASIERCDLHGGCRAGAIDIE
jgi:hypothetical protein